MKNPREIPEDTFEKLNPHRRHGAHVWKRQRDYPTCGGKYSYSKNGVIDARSRGLRGGVPYLRVYRCNRCPYWHLTHKPPRTP